MDQYIVNGQAYNVKPEDVDFFMQKYPNAQKVETTETKQPSKASTLGSSLALGFTEFFKGFENIKEGVQLGVAELLMPGEMDATQKKIALQSIRATNVFGNSESYDPLIEKLEQNIPQYETKSITEDIQKGNYSQAGFRIVNAALRSTPSLVAAATGVGGIMRDVFTMGARPIANLNSIHFGKVLWIVYFLI